MTQKLPQICTVILRILLGGFRDLPYIFAVTYGPSSTVYLILLLNRGNHIGLDGMQLFHYPILNHIEGGLVPH